MTLMEILMEEDPNPHEENVSGFPFKFFMFSWEEEMLGTWILEQHNIIALYALFPIEIFIYFVKKSRFF